MHDIDIVPITSSEAVPLSASWRLANKRANRWGDVTITLERDDGTDRVEVYLRMDALMTFALNGKSPVTAPPAQEQPGITRSELEQIAEEVVG